MKIIDKLYYTITDFVYPQFCIKCDKLLDSGRECAFCDECRNIILAPPKYENICFKCGRILEINPIIKDSKIICADCRHIKKKFNHSRHIYLYSDYIRKLITEYKYYHNRDFAFLFADEIIKYINDENNLYSKLKFDYVINVPMHIHRKIKRAFDHIDLICRIISEKKKVAYLKNMILKIKPTVQQAGLKRKERLKNIRNSFAMNDIKENLDNKKILLIDDVYSTGATVNECSLIVKRKFKNANIFVLTIARGE